MGRLTEMLKLAEIIRILLEEQYIIEINPMSENILRISFCYKKNGCKLTRLSIMAKYSENDLVESLHDMYKIMKMTDTEVEEC